MKTLTSIGIQKIGQRFVDSVDHADYTLNGVPQTAEPFRRFVQGASARVYIYFDDTVIGDVAEVQLVDKDGDIIASAGERVFTKTPGKGLYIMRCIRTRKLDMPDRTSLGAYLSLPSMKS